MTDLLKETCLSTPASRLTLSLLLTAGMLSAPLQANAANFNVATEGQLQNAINSAANGDTITFTANITLSSNLPVVTKSVTFNGGAFSLSGANQYRGLLIQSGTVAINDLNIVNARAQGGKGGNGDGGSGGGGGAGLGGALFVGSGAHVTVSNVGLKDNSAHGGAGGTSTSNGTSGGGGSYWPTGADGGDGGLFVSGGGGTNGGGDGSTNGNGSNGGFGGGAGGGGAGIGGTGGFGGGGGGSSANAPHKSPGGFLGGAGGRLSESGKVMYYGGGGGGAGLGGALFVQEGGTIALAGALVVSGNTVAGGSAGSGGYLGDGTAGGAAGNGLFLQGSGTLTLTPSGGQTQTISDAIVDQSGAGGTGTNAGSWSLVKDGAGTTVLFGANTYSGGTTVNSGILQGNTGSLHGGILNNATVVFEQTGAGTYAGDMSGTGAVIVRGSGEVTFAGTNTYSGGTTVTGGRLLFTSDANLGTAGKGISVTDAAIGPAPGVGGQTFNRPLTITNSGGIYVSQFQTFAMTWSGTIDGTGTLVKSGSGELILSGANTYSGGTTVSDGLLRISADANLGAAGTAITLNGGGIGTVKEAPATLTIGRAVTLGTGGGSFYVDNNPLTWSGNIGGSGQLIKDGAGALLLTGTNTYSGGTQVMIGTVQVASDDKLGAAGTAVMLYNNGALFATDTFATARTFNLEGAGGTLLVNGGKTLTLTGTVAGTSILKVGDGTLILAGNSTYTGTTQVFQGILQGNTTTVRGNIAFDESPLSKTMVFDQETDGTFAGNIAGVGTTNGSGAVVKNGNGKLILSGTSKYTGGTTVNAGTLQGTSNSLQGKITNNAAVIFDQAFNGTYAGDMTGTGTLTKNGTGKLNLTGISTVGGGTTINAGGFAVNGHLNSNVTLNKGGTLSGTGNITGDIVNHGGTINPGNSIGTITVNGNFTFNSGTYEVEVNAQGNSDRINVIGAGHKAMINAGTLLIVPDAGTYTPNTTYTIITTQNGGTVKFDNVAGGVGFLTPRVSLDRHNVYVTLALAPNAFASAGQTINQQAVGGALDAIAASGSVGGIVTTMANLPTAQGSSALQALSGQPYADFGTLNTRASQLFMNSVGRQMATERGAGLGGPQRVALAEACDTTCDTTEPSRFGAWVAGIGSTGSVLGDANASGFTYTMGGTAFGIDYRLDPRFLVGIAGGYTSGTQWVNGFSGNGYSDSFSVALYSSFTQGGFYADALAGYANASNRMQRVISLPGNPTGLANGNTSANQFLGQIEAGYKFGLGLGANTSISPFARLQIGSINQAGFTEYGGGPFNLAVAAQNTTSVRTTFGVDLAGGFDIGGTLLDLGLRLGWMHEFADTARPMTAGFAASPVSQFTVFGATPQRDSAVLGFSAATALGDRTSLFVSYDGEIGGGTDNHALRAGFRMTW